MDTRFDGQPRPGTASDPHTAACALVWLVVTDLDGTLLDDGYDLPAAAAALNRLSARGHRVALASSKTLDEMLALAALCDQAPILIFENGAGFGWPLAFAAPGRPPRYAISFEGEGYAELRAHLRCLRRRGDYRFLGFGDLSALEVARHTGLTPDAARLARHRAASEPLLWLDSDARLADFESAVSALGYRCVAGGRFLHVMPRTDKAQAMRRVQRRLRAETAAALPVVACGDADNDLGMLQAADRALVFPRRDGGYLELRDGLGRDVGVRAPGAGPDNWSAALDALLSGAGVCPGAANPEGSHE